MKRWRFITALLVCFSMLAAQSGWGTAGAGDERWDASFITCGPSYEVAAMALDAQGKLYSAGIVPGATSGTYVPVFDVWDGTQWSRLAGGPTAGTNIFDILPAPDGSVYIAGEYMMLNGQDASIVKWDGQKWTVVLPDSLPAVFHLALDSKGNLYAGGWIPTLDGKTMNHIAMWDGAAWHALGSGLGSDAQAIAVDAQDRLYVTGAFTSAGGKPANRIAMWDGAAWSALGSGLSGSGAVLALDGSTLYVGGDFIQAGGSTVNHLARWDGAAWSGLGSGFDGTVTTLAVGPNHALTAGGNFNKAGGQWRSNLARWSGTTWENVGGGTGDEPNALAVSKTGRLYLAGGGSFVNDLIASLAQWDGSSWTAVGNGQGMNNTVNALGIDSKGRVHAGGAFEMTGCAPASKITRFQNGQWTEAFPISVYPSSRVNAMVFDPYDNLFIGGKFWAANGVLINSVFALDPDGSISAPAAMKSMEVRAMALDASGKLVIAGDPLTTSDPLVIARWGGWDDNQWTNIAPSINNSVNALVLAGNGALVAGGAFTNLGSASGDYIAAYKDGVWSALGSGVNGTVKALAAAKNGSLYAGGYFTSAGGAEANHVAVWNGSSWNALGTGLPGPVFALALDANGRLYAAGDKFVALWNGSTWSQLGSGVDGSANALQVDKSGNLWVGGDFTHAGGKESLNIARWNFVSENQKIFLPAVRQ